MRADDALKYAAARLRARTDWALDSISGSTCDHHGHEDELNAISDGIKEVAALASQFGDPLRYSDGRIVQSSKWIDEGLSTGHVWHPVPELEEIQSHRGCRLP